ncbi:MAG TPA: ABC transporter permease subunit, partial [Blastocatellia bacterium]|nr:ABC transporter permease subunit [Blastocatellia bacterium]
ERRLYRMHDFASHSEAVTAISPSNRDKGFLTGDAKGGIELHYATTGRTRLNLRSRGQDVASLSYAPRADGFASIDNNGTIQNFELENRHPEITLATLFNKVWYEGEAQPEHTWQSTGGADDFEAKFGLMPLIYGTLKGSVYTLILSVPIAILAALYASQFMRPRWKSIIKPAVEIMAGLPSVVLGFIAALWLAPNVETVLPGVLMMPTVLPVLVLAAVFARRTLPAKWRSFVKPGRELFALVPLVGAGIWLSILASGFVTNKLIGGDYHSWLATRLGLSYDQRNSLVVSFAMGFAVIPIIFTIAEDAFTNVPRHLTLAARALGATKWQTALRVVVPTASPGIFSAVMVGLGRAVGETMIVLMATGNTPIMSWNIFNGFRALSANIAVELPEAPAGATLYRVLFLTALLLFALTFVVNTAAEVVRLRLRKRYSAL